MKKNDIYKVLKKYFDKKSKSLKHKLKKLRKKCKKLFENKFYIVIIASALFIFALSAIGFFIGRSSTSMDRTLDSFVSAIKSSDEKGLR